MWSLSPPLTSISKKGLLEFVINGFGPWDKCDASRGQDSLSGARSKVMQEQVAKCLSYCEVGGSEFYASVALKGFGWTKNNKPVWPSSSQRKHLSPQLTRQVRSHKDLQGINWKICNELDAGNAEQKKQKRNLDEVFLKGETNMHETNARAQKRTQENFI